ncbi:hypothetical protein Q7P37_003569 [Cladosporium fusiforme]
MPNIAAPLECCNEAAYIPIGEINAVNNAINFSTPDLHVIGGCDIYTTKAAGGDKKLYKNIEDTLESQYATLVKLSASLSPPPEIRNGGEKHRESIASIDDSGRNERKHSRTMEIPEIDLSRASPFGPLSQSSARRTFAYLIATLNASHSDYDFSHLLRPSDFRKERSLRSLVHNVDSTLYNLRPRSSSVLANQQYLAPPNLSSSAPVANGFGNEFWGPRMWSILDKEMNLRECERYSYMPQDDPFDGEEGAIWSLHYFFFNKERKRVCYLYLRGLSVLSHSPVHAPMHIHRTRQNRDSGVSVGEGAGKRANYWLGSSIDEDDVMDEGEYEDDDDEIIHDEYERQDDEIEVPYMDLDEVRNRIVDGYNYDFENIEYEEDTSSWRAADADAEGEKDVAPHSKRGVRGMSEEIGDAMEM